MQLSDSEFAQNMSWWRAKWLSFTSNSRKSQRSVWNKVISFKEHWTKIQTSVGMETAAVQTWPDTTMWSLPRSDSIPPRCLSLTLQPAGSQYRVQEARRTCAWLQASLEVISHQHTFRYCGERHRYMQIQSISKWETHAEDLGAEEQRAVRHWPRETVKLQIQNVIRQGPDQPALPDHALSKAWSPEVSSKITHFLLT